MMFDETGKVVAHPDRKLILNDAEKQRVAHLTEKILSGESSFFARFDGVEKLYVVSRVKKDSFNLPGAAPGSPNLMANDWYIVSGQPVSEIVEVVHHAGVLVPVLLDRARDLRGGPPLPAHHEDDHRPAPEAHARRRRDRPLRGPYPEDRRALRRRDWGAEPDVQPDGRQAPRHGHEPAPEPRLAPRGGDKPRDDEHRSARDDHPSGRGAAGDAGHGPGDQADVEHGRAEVRSGAEGRVGGGRDWSLGRDRDRADPHLAHGHPLRGRGDLRRRSASSARAPARLGTSRSRSGTSRTSRTCSRSTPPSRRCGPASTGRASGWSRARSGTSPISPSRPPTA